MNELIKIRSQRDHVIQWTKLKRLYVSKRGSDPGKNRKQIPRTTNADIAELTTWWHKEFVRGVGRNPRGNKADQQRWVAAKKKIERDLEDTDPAALYPHNEWFWQEATARVSIFLEAAKAVPTAAELLFESFEESIDDRIDDAKDLAAKATDTITEAGKGALSVLKTGALITAGVVGAAIVVPPVIRAIRKD